MSTLPAELRDLIESGPLAHLSTTNADGSGAPSGTLPAASGAIVLTGGAAAPARGGLSLNVITNPRRRALEGSTGRASGARSARLRRTVLIRGRTTTARRGGLRLRVERLGKGRSGFGHVFRRLPTGSYRVSASYRPANGRAVSRTRTFQLHR